MTLGMIMNRDGHFDAEENVANKCKKELAVNQAPGKTIIASKKANASGKWKWNHSQHLKTNQRDLVAQAWVTRDDNTNELVEPYNVG